MCARLCEAMFVYTMFVYVKERDKEGNREGKMQTDVSLCFDSCIFSPDFNYK